MTPREGHYGVTIEEDHSLKIEYYEDVSHVCYFNGCTANGYYQTYVRQMLSLGSVDEPLWLCGEHILNMASEFVRQIEFKRKVT